MIHLGDITKIDGSKILPVAVIIGGSPCQDLSIAGKREGLSGERSGLLMEQIRIIKEMHKEYGTVYPRFMVWENVPGALSSNKGEDFRIVLEETARIAEADAVIPRPPKGKWKNSGCIMGDGWSIAWRIFDAQFWGVPQRRRRIALVADFGGESAPEILFERKGVSGYTPQGFRSWQGAAGTFAEGAGASGCVCLNDQGGASLTVEQKEVSPTLRSQTHGNLPVVAMGFELQQITSKANRSALKPVQPTLCGAGNPHVICMATGQANASILEDTSPTLTHSNERPIVVYPELAGTLCASGAGLSRPAGMASETDFCIVEAGEAWESLVRRLTPVECERLQGFPDGWTNIGDYIDSKGKKKHTADTARYRALGNSIALPPWRWVLKRLCNQYDRCATMGSLFDGIGGFPLIWEEINGKGSCLWASEIEEFPIAVTKIRVSE